MICWTDMPEAQLVRRSKAETLLLDAMLIIVLYARIKVVVDDVFISEFFVR